MPIYDPAARFEVSVSEVEYLRHGDEPLLARIYQPQGPGPFAVLLDVHGGQWSSGSREGNQRVDHALAESGAVVVAIDFRLAPQHPYPAQLQDINYGIRWLKANAQRFHADPATVAGIGGSSGGHGIVLSALRPHDPRYAALPLTEAPQVDASLAYVISMWGIVDPHARYLFAMSSETAGEGRGGPGRLQQSTFGYFGDEAGMLEGNPQMILERGETVSLPPLLVIQGDEDRNIPWQIPHKFAETWRTAGGEATFELFAGQPHAFANQPGAESDRAVETIRRFISAQMAR